MAKTCSYGGCELPMSCKGFCNAHYMRWVRGSDMSAPIRVSGLTETERFWEKVNRTDSCWVWTGAIQNGYGMFRHQGYARLAHRVAFQWTKGPIPDGMEVDHMCFNRACVNPAHLRLLTHTENGQNRASANRNSKSGVRGVSRRRSDRMWIARAMLSRKEVFIGAFESREDAECAAIEWRKENMPASIQDINHGSEN